MKSMGALSLEIWLASVPIAKILRGHLYEVGTTNITSERCSKILIASLTLPMYVKLVHSSPSCMASLFNRAVFPSPRDSRYLQSLSFSTLAYSSHDSGTSGREVTYTIVTLAFNF